MCEKTGRNNAVFLRLGAQRELLVVSQFRFIPALCDNHHRVVFALCSLKMPIRTVFLLA